MILERGSICLVTIRELCKFKLRFEQGLRSIRVKEEKNVEQSKLMFWTISNMQHISTNIGNFMILFDDMLFTYTYQESLTKFFSRIKYKHYIFVFIVCDIKYILLEA